MSRTTIAIHTDTRARLNAAAAEESMTLDSFLQTLLDERERARFWESFADVTPETYSRAVAADGDSLDEDYTIEDAGLEAQES
jgi:hypothetical protein